MRCRYFRPRTGQRRSAGFALILVLIVVAMLALSGYTFCSLMVTEDESAILYGQQLQARMLVESGAAHVRYLLELDPASRQGLGGLYENPQLFQAQLVIDHVQPRGRARFGVIAPRLDQQGMWNGLRFGLQDESSRLNLNALNLDLSAAADALGGASALSGSSSSTGGSGTGGNGGASSGGSGATGGAATGNSASTPNSGAGAGGSGTPGGTGATSGGDGASGGSSATAPIDTSARSMLMKLPGMTVDVADAILDWIDPDDEPREYGAEIDYYSGLVPPYTPANGPLKTIEELLLVRGVTPDLLFGRDVNRNGIIDVQEANLPLLVQYDDGTGAADMGWAAFLTLFSQERNVTSTGQPRINVNGEDMQQLFDELSAAVDVSWATYIVAYRQFGPYTQNPNANNGGQDGEQNGGENSAQGNSQGENAGNDQNVNEQDAGSQTLDLTKQGQHQLTQLLDLIGTKVQATLSGQEGTVIIRSPFQDNPVAMATYLPKLMDLCSTSANKTIPGRVNINQAPRPVLLAIPGMTEEIVDAIISQRNVDESEMQTDLQHETWPMARAIVTLQEMRTLLPFVTAAGDVHRAQIVGYFDGGEISSRVEVVFDATTPLPRILSWRDISHLGRGYPRELLGVDLSTATLP
jgi:DNA uptake protein ComE-like DNA-binding protein